MHLPCRVFKILFNKTVRTGRLLKEEVSASAKCSAAPYWTCIKFYHRSFLIFDQKQHKSFFCHMKFNEILLVEGPINETSN